MTPPVNAWAVIALISSLYCFTALLCCVECKPRFRLPFGLIALFLFVLSAIAAMQATGIQHMLEFLR